MCIKCNVKWLFEEFSEDVFECFYDGYERRHIWHDFFREYITHVESLSEVQPPGLRQRAIISLQLSWAVISLLRKMTFHIAYKIYGLLHYFLWINKELLLGEDHKEYFKDEFPCNCPE